MIEMTRLVRVSVELLHSFGSRTERGQRITAEWGEPVATIGDEPGLTFDIYEPTFTVSGDTEADRIATAKAEALREAAERVRALVRPYDQCHSRSGLMCDRHPCDRVLSVADVLAILEATE